MRSAARVGDQRPAAIGARAIEQRTRGAPVLEHRGAEPAVEGGGDRELVTGVDLELVRQNSGAAGRGGLAAQELIDGRELPANSRRLAAGDLDGPL